jgi:sporulation protein YlmC with PRC-barrel domain
MTKPLEIKSLSDNLINKSVHTSDGVYIGNIHDIESQEKAEKHLMIRWAYRLQIKRQEKK